MPLRARVFCALGCLAMLVNATLPAAAASQTANYKNAHLRGANFQGAVLQRADFENADLRNADFQNADLRGADFRGANLRSANLQGAGLQGANLASAALLGANLQRCNSQDAIFENANLQHANLQGVLLFHANLSGADLRQADLLGANLETASLQNADLRGTNLQGANLLGADMHGAITTGTAPRLVRTSAPKVVAAVNPALTTASPSRASSPAPTALPLAAASLAAHPRFWAPAARSDPVAPKLARGVVHPIRAKTPDWATMAAEALFGAVTSDSQHATTIRLHADRVQFFYDSFLVEADGNVQVRTSDGMTLSGDAFSMDLKLNRFVIAGHAHMQNATGSQDGAAVADFLDFNRIYFVPFIRDTQAATGVPDHWTFLDGDFAHPAKGREMPGDTFYFPDLGNTKPYILTKSAVIESRSFVRFGSARFDIANGLGFYLPLPSYYVNFSSDPHLGDNSLAGANYDATYEFAGNANSISALHFRYDTVNKTYFSFEQHLSGPKAYAVFSVNPMTRPSKFWDLLLSDRPSPYTQIRTFSQLHTFQFGLSSPLESQQVTTLQLTQALRGTYLQSSFQFENFSLLPLGCYGAPPCHGTVPNHPANLQVLGQTFDQPLTPYFHGGRLYAHMNYGFGYQHDSLGLQTLGGVNYTTIWQHQLGFQLYVPDFKFGSDTNVPTKYYALNSSFDKQRQWNSTGHYIDTEQTKVSLSKILDAHFLAYLEYSVQNVGDYYGPLQSIIYPGFTPVVNGVAYPGYQAFHGLATFRTASFGLNYSNAGYFTFNLLARKHTDFPAPIPFFFSFAQPDILGNFTVQNFLGQPPYDVTAEVRMRINPHMSIDIQRAYYFNYSNLRWSPHFVIQVLR